jgi:prepilin-type N-terminal cleavage/methylation domain-containing protein
MSKKSQLGFTLVEMVVVIGILSIISAGLSLMIDSGYKVFRYSNNELSSLDQAAVVMRDFEKTVRGATIFDVAQTSQVTFLAYQAGDNYPAPSKISYFSNNGSYTKTVIPPTANGNQFTYPDANKKTMIIASGVTNTSFFTFYNENGEVLAAPVQPEVIRMVKLDVTIGGKVPASETTTVQIRNLKTNL